MLIDNSMMHHCISILLGIMLLAAGSNGVRQWRGRLPLPSRVGVLRRDLTEVIVLWEQPKGTNYDRFTVSIKPPSATVDDPSEQSQTFRYVRGLKPGTSYVVTIRGITEDGRQSPTKHYRLWSEPLPPTNLKLDVIESLEIGFTFGDMVTTFSVETVGVQVSWEEPSSATSTSDYTVQVTPTGGVQAHPQPLEAEEDRKTVRMFIGLIPGEEYTFTIRTHVGPPYQLVYSSPVSQTIRIPPLKPLLVREGTIGASHATIRTVGPLQGVHESLILELSPSHGEISPGMPDPDDLTHDLHMISGLTPNTEYTLNVYSVSYGVRSTKPTTISFTTASDPPVDLEVIEFTEESVTLQWDHPPSLLTEESIEYIIKYQDLKSLHEPETERVTVDDLDTRVYVSIQKLEPGSTYSFMIFTAINNSISEVAEIEQTIIPPKPELVSLNRIEGGVSIKLMAPDIGQCPQVIVSYSPPLLGEDFVQPRIYNIDETFSLLGLPGDEKYTIHTRCISNNIEGPPLVISSRAQRNPESGSYEDDPTAPRGRLPCSLARDSSKPVPPDFVAPDACCGLKPYHTVSQICCGNLIRRAAGNTASMLCCVNKFYSAIEQVCCGGGIINTRSVGCDQSNRPGR